MHETSIAHDAGSVFADLPSKDGFTWRPHALVEKWDQEQVDWVARRTGVLVPSGDLLAAHVAPYDVAEAAGNLLTTAGLNRLTSLLIGAGGQALTNTSARLGVGNSTTAAAVGQTDLQASAGSANRQFKVMDATYPQQSNGVVTAKSTFATGEANFAWQEWCLDIGTPTVADGTTVNAVMLNRKVESLGTKVSGAWALTVTITIA
ncbi:hypothetical protein GON03_18960 [Nocardioides sp. MAH-18]|uniref:Uncharacterized protein n=1 Tax=Nocardioides agri TaxID=2682843 RepID=A0A6L6XXX1_9ACTN|nr:MULTISPECIES: hypothetical protein [unclassified Nocardioides]MBA2952097.1 hypothetical protein [Nocardioides sp. CGMCC 1.13656]MVQ51266.1 hypothetical protein [Nocardioides sp. MAH-18]